MCACAHVHVLGEEVQKKARWGRWMPWNCSYRWLSVAPCGCWPQNSDPQQEQQALWTNEPSPADCTPFPILLKSVEFHLENLWSAIIPLWGWVLKLRTVMVEKQFVAVCLTCGEQHWTTPSFIHLLRRNAILHMFLGRRKSSWLSKWLWRVTVEGSKSRSSLKLSLPILTDSHSPLCLSLPTPFLKRRECIFEGCFATVESGCHKIPAP